MNLNDQFTVQVNGAGIQNLQNAVFVLTYNPALLEVVSQADGGFLKQGGASATLQAFVDKKKGELWISSTRDAAAPGVSGSGTLATVVFKAIGKGSVPMAFSTTNLSTGEGVKLPVTPFKSVVEVR